MAKWIMVVDDDTTNLQMAGHILSQHNMRVTALKSGRAMLDYIVEKGEPDLVLLDIKMPEMDGFEALKLLRELEKKNGWNETPVIFLTADEDRATETRGFEEGVSDFIRKPFHPDVLLRRIDNVVSAAHEMRNLKDEVTLDKLTGFLNKAATTSELSKMCVDQTGCLLMIDLDSFKLVNDLYGHDMGDKVLTAFANIIRETMPEGSKNGRIGGDEFTSFALGVKTEEEVAQITAALNSKLVATAKEMMGEDMSIPLGASVGGIMVPKQGNDYQSLLKQADKALYKVKKHGKHGYRIYTSDSISEGEVNTASLSLGEISEILGERNIPEVALQLEMEAFSHVYRYVIRYIARHNVTASKVLFTLNPGAGIDEATYKDLCDEFGNHIRQSLRKSDILTRSRFNQYYVFLTDIREEFAEKVISQITESWKEENGDKVSIEIETELIHNEFNLITEPGERKVVIVGEKSDYRDLAQKILTDDGIKVTVLNTGKELIDLMKRSVRRPDLILMDATMQGMDGFETLDGIKNLEGPGANTPVVLLTSDEDVGLELKGLKQGAMDIIRKPFIPEVLLVRVNHIMELIMLRKRLHR